MTVRSDAAPPPSWWRGPAALTRVVGDLVAGEFARLRPGSAPQLPPHPWTPELAIGEDGLGADSLDLLGLASALAELLEMRRSGIEDYLLMHRRFGDWQQIAAAALERFDSVVTFRTSGSTGAGTSCSHDLAALEAEAAFLATLLGGRRRLLTAVPAHHIYGFIFTVLLPRHLGIEVPVVDLRGRSPAALGAVLQPGDLVVAHPAWWSVVLQVAPGLPAGVAGTSSTAPCPPELAIGLQALGLERLVEVFGSSETSGLGWRDDPDDGFAPFPWWRFEDGIAERAGAAGPCRHDLPDRLAWHDGRFLPQGRRDHVVQVGGINVSPARVRERLLAHPDIADCAVRLMRPEEGQRLKAFIVPATGAAPEVELRRSLTAWIQGNLPVAERPRALSFGPVLPTGATGKAADWPVHAA
ncbi:AMP-binding protein [Marinibaculum pumilum]|uniref:AMP-binding protein n=1 Tax=Marinibaculum pumilum TaxID=1766165 RepID=A0ABV7KWX8_9PROT